jgi:hypothetical protein
MSNAALELVQAFCTHCSKRFLFGEDSVGNYLTKVKSPGSFKRGIYHTVDLKMY